MKNEKPLKPCPFCLKTNTAHITTHDGLNERFDGEFDKQCAEDPDHEHRYAVICNFNNGGCGGCSGFRGTEKEALEEWNRRAFRRIKKFKDWGGFDTGGGCTALKCHTTYGYFLITDTEGLSIPDEHDNEIYLGAWTHDKVNEDNERFVLKLNHKTGAWTHDKVNEDNEMFVLKLNHKTGVYTIADFTGDVFDLETWMDVLRPLLRLLKTESINISYELLWRCISNYIK